MRIETKNSTSGGFLPNTTLDGIEKLSTPFSPLDTGGEGTEWKVSFNK